MFLLSEAVYGLAVNIRLALYHIGILPVKRLPVPVISIGNLTTGGTGKTPVTISLAKFLEKSGFKVAVLSRGYGGRKKTDFHEADNPDYGDEPFMIQQHLSKGKVFIGKNRFLTGSKAIDIFNPEIILLDDGFQHISLYRDMNIVLVDGQYGFGNNHMLPSGPLREPVTELKRADWILMTREIDNPNKEMTLELVKKLDPKKRINVAECPFKASELFHPASQTSANFSKLEDRSIIMLSGIAQPAAFEYMVKRHIPANRFLEHIVFADHHNYLANDLSSLAKKIQDNPETVILTTEKDWVKIDPVCPRSLRPNLYIFRIEPCFDWQQIVASIYTLLPANKHL